MTASWQPDPSAPDVDHQVPAHSGFADTTRDRLRTSILDAVGAQLHERPWSEVTMADVGSAAGVSRQTVYNTFGSRRELAAAYAARETDRFMDEVAAVVTSHLDEPHTALVAAIEMFIHLVEQHPLVVVRASGGEELLTLFTTQRGPILDGLTARLAALITTYWPITDADVLADGLVRLAVSYAASGPRPASEVSDRIARLVGPFIDVKLVELLD